jgi:hypothetical protein
MGKSQFEANLANVDIVVDILGRGNNKGGLAL